MAGNEIQDWLVSRFATVANDDGSPMETLFRAGLAVNAKLLTYEGNQSFKLGAQERIGPYRVDFVLEAYGVEIIIEVDGHEFHEKTKEQAAHDKKRDRYMTQHGHTVLRFTGSEVWANPFKCAEQAFAVAHMVAMRGAK